MNQLQAAFIQQHLWDAACQASADKGCSLNLPTRVPPWLLGTRLTAAAFEPVRYPLLCGCGRAAM